LSEITKPKNRNCFFAHQSIALASSLCLRFLVKKPKEVVLTRSQLQECERLLLLLTGAAAAASAFFKFLHKTATRVQERTNHLPEEGTGLGLEKKFGLCSHVANPRPLLRQL
jgi:hypothetical protein